MKGRQGVAALCALLLAAGCCSFHRELDFKVDTWSGPNVKIRVGDRMRIRDGVALRACDEWEPGLFFKHWPGLHRMLCLSATQDDVARLHPRAREFAHLPGMASSEVIRRFDGEHVLVVKGILHASLIDADSSQLYVSMDGARRTYIIDEYGFEALAQSGKIAELRDARGALRAIPPPTPHDLP